MTPMANVETLWNDYCTYEMVNYDLQLINEINRCSRVSIKI